MGGMMISTILQQANFAFKMRVDNGGETKYLALFQGSLNSQDWIDFHEIGKRHLQIIFYISYSLNVFSLPKSSRDWS